MNIYMHLEITVRELDSKLLMAILAASKGHQVIISGSMEINMALKTGVLNPGIVHTKSLTPSDKKISTHQKIIDNKSIITSIDEEASINEFGYDKFAIERYSEVTIEQSSAIFGWGTDDVSTLKKKYPEYSHKIYKTGSPRVDLWKPFFSDYWVKSKNIISEPFLLVSSNIFVTNTQPFHESLKFNRDAGYMHRDPDLFKRSFYSMSNNYKKLYEFIDAIKYLAKNSNGYSVVLRPHPMENITAWKNFLEGVKNIHIIRKDCISLWVKNAFAIMHNGCTTGIEAIVSQKPLLTYNTTQMNIEDYFLSNKLGHNIKSKEELLKKTNQLFEIEKHDNKTNEKPTIPSLVLEKLYIDKNELAAEKILKVWESLNTKSLSQSNNWIKFRLLLKIIELRNFFLNIMSKLNPKKFNPIKENQKFQSMNESDICARATRLQSILGIDKKLKCKLLSKRTILIKID
jgi:surface carbohydrate biosynthesis protein